MILADRYGCRDIVALKSHACLRWMVHICHYYKLTSYALSSAAESASEKGVQIADGFVLMLNVGLRVARTVFVAMAAAGYSIGLLLA